MYSAQTRRSAGDRGCAAACRLGVAPRCPRCASPWVRRAKLTQRVGGPAVWGLRGCAGQWRARRSRGLRSGSANLTRRAGPSAAWRADRYTSRCAGCSTCAARRPCGRVGGCTARRAFARRAASTLRAGPPAVRGVGGCTARRAGRDVQGSAPPGGAEPGAASVRWAPGTSWRAARRRAYLLVFNYVMMTGEF